jgi:hypothetical protein
MSRPWMGCLWMGRTLLAVVAVPGTPTLAQQPLVQYPYGQQPPMQTQELPPLQQQWEDHGQRSMQTPLPPTRTFAPASPAAPPAPMAPPLAGGQVPSLPSGSVATPGLPTPMAPTPPSSPTLVTPTLVTPTLAAPDMTPLPRSSAWVPSGTAKLQALDKVNAQTTTLTVKVGQSTTFGSLTIAVKACMVRPPDQPADAAAYVDVTDSHPDSPSFNGWLLEQEPSASMMEHPIYDIRVSGCT